MKFKNCGSESFNTLLPCELKYRRVTRAFPACLKQMSCCGRFHSNILTLPSWAPVMSENMTKTSNRSFIKTYSVCVWNKETHSIDRWDETSFSSRYSGSSSWSDKLHTQFNTWEMFSQTHIQHWDSYSFFIYLQFNLKYSIVWFSERFAWIVHCKCTIKYANYWQYHTMCYQIFC